MVRRAVASRTGAWADRLNSMPKYVVSATLDEPQWTNSTVLKGDVVNEVSKLKQELAGEIVVYASIQLGHALLEHDLVDELRLMVFPVVARGGRAPVRRDQRREAHAPGQRPAIGDGLALPHLPARPGRLAGRSFQ